MSDAAEKRRIFRELHQPGAPLLMPNPWDIGSAMMLKAKGMKAFGTTSSGFAFTLGLPDGCHVDRATAIAHAKAVTEASGLPVSGDLENGYGHAPDMVAKTVRLAAEAGLAGCSIEDTTLPDGGSYSYDEAMARAKAAIEAARESGIVLTLRADGILAKSYDEAEAIRRCQGFAELGADVIYAPCVSADAVREIVKTGTPVNVLAVGEMAKLGVSGLADLGTARISIGSALARVTHRAIAEAGEAMAGGDLSVLTTGMSGGAVDRMLTG